MILMNGYLLVRKDIVTLIVYIIFSLLPLAYTSPIPPATSLSPSNSFTSARSDLSQSSIDLSKGSRHEAALGATSSSGQGKRTMTSQPSSSSIGDYVPENGVLDEPGFEEGRIPRKIEFPRLGIVLLPTERVGKGYTSKVFKVPQPNSSGKFMAIKVPKYIPAVERELIRSKEISVETLSNQNEIEVLKRTKQLLDVAYLKDERRVIAMKWVEGQSLEAIAEQDKIKDLRDLEKYRQAIQRALKSLHKKGILQNDINSGNFMIKEQSGPVAKLLGRPYKAKVIDHGFASIASKKEAKSNDFGYEDRRRADNVIDDIKFDMDSQS